MDTMETFTMNLAGGLLSLPISEIAICLSVITIVVHICIAVGVFRDAARLPTSREPIFVGRIIWLKK